MGGENVVQSVDSLLKFCVTGLLVLAAIVFLSVFTITREDWFFGIKLDGLPAGLYLLDKAVVAGALAGLFIRFPQRTTLLAGFSILYFGFLFLDSAITFQKNTGGQSLFSPLFAVFLAVPVVYFILRLMTGRTGPEGVWSV